MTTARAYPALRAAGLRPNGLIHPPRLFTTRGNTPSRTTEREDGSRTEPESPCAFSLLLLLFFFFWGHLKIAHGGSMKTQEGCSLSTPGKDSLRSHMVTDTHGSGGGGGGTGYTKLCFRSFSSASAAQLTDGGVFSPHLFLSQSQLNCLSLIRS